MQHHPISAPDPLPQPSPPSRFLTRAELFSYIIAHPHQLLRGRYLGHAKSRTQVRVVIHDTNCEKAKISGTIAYVRARGTIEARFTRRVTDDDQYQNQSDSVSDLEKEISFHIRMDEADLNMRAPRGSKAGSMARSFFDSMENMRLKVEWRPNTQPLIVYGEGQLWLLGENNDPTAEYTKIECTLDTSSLYQALDEGESPISHQPISTLAMMCRYLDGRDLIAVYKVNRLMSQAASHPIVHQSGQSVDVASSLIQPYRSYVTDGGMTCTFTLPGKMKSALSSRLLRHTRILRIRSTDSQPHLHVWLKYLTDDESVVPSLRALRIEAVEMHETQLEGHILEEAAEQYLTHCTAFTQLKLIHLTLPVSVVELLIPHLPASVELLHCTLCDTGLRDRDSVLPLNLVSHLRSSLDASANSKLTRFLFQLLNENSSARKVYPDLALLCQIEQISPAHEVHYDIRARLNEVEMMRNDLILPTHQLRLKEYQIVFDLKCDPHHLFSYLRHFAALNKLTLEIQYSMNQQQSRSSSPCVWPEAVRRTLKELHLKCTDATLMESLKVLGSTILPSLSTLIIWNLSSSKINVGTGDDMVSLLPKFSQQMPNLTCLIVPGITFTGPTLSLFELLPHLTSLHSFEYPHFDHPDEMYDPNMNLSRSFPSLTSFEVVLAREVTIPTHAIRSIPLLRHFKWLREEWIHSREAIEERLTLAEAHQQAELKKREEIRMKAELLMSAQMKEPITPSHSQPFELNQNSVAGGGSDGAPSASSSVDSPRAGTMPPSTIDSAVVPLFNFSTLSFGVESTSPATVPTSTLSFTSSSAFSSFLSDTSSSSTSDTAAAAFSSSFSFVSSDAFSSTSPVLPGSSLQPFQFDLSSTAETAEATTGPPVGTCTPAINPFLPSGTDSGSGAFSSLSSTSLAALTPVAASPFSFTASVFAPTLTPTSAPASENVNQASNVDEELRSAFHAFVQSFQQESPRPRAPGL